MIRQEDLFRFVGLIQRLKDQAAVYKVNSDSLLKNSQSSYKWAPCSHIKYDFKQFSKDKYSLNNLDATFEGFEIKPRLSAHLKLPNFICNGKTSIKYKRINHKRSSTSIIQTRNQSLKKQLSPLRENQPTLTIKALGNTLSSKIKINKNKKYQNEESRTLRTINLSQQEKPKDKKKNICHKSILICEQKQNKNSQSYTNFAQNIIKKKIKKKLMKIQQLQNKPANDGWIIDGWEQDQYKHQIEYNNA